MKMPYWVSLQVRPMGDICNIGCKYCHYGLAKGSTRMSEQVLSTLISKAFKHNQSGCLFNWHGGEPTLIGLDFYHSAVKYQQEFYGDAEAINTMQTNAIGLNDEMASFFAKNKFYVSVSLDGPRQLHDSVRVDKNGRGTHDCVIAGIQLLQKHGINPPVIATVSKPSLKYAKETFHHLVGLGVTNIHYSVVFNSLPDRSLEISSEEWYQYLSTVLHEWCSVGNPSIVIRELNEVISWLSGVADPTCTSLGTCGHWFSVDYNGEVYPCEVLGKSISYGNILNNTFEQILSSVNHRQLLNIIQSRPGKCMQCKFLNVCNNGCTQVRLDYDGSRSMRGLYAYCDQRLRLFEEIKELFGC